MNLSQDNCSQETKAKIVKDPHPFLSQLDKGWNVNGSTLSRSFVFSQFKNSLAFVNTIAAIADFQEVFPEIVLYNKHVKISMNTGRLSYCCFIFAAKIDAALHLMGM